MDGDTFQVVSNKEEKAIQNVDDFGAYIEKDPDLKEVSPP